MKLIELTGIPGSGKSTVAPIIKDFFSKKGFDVHDAVSVIHNGRSFPLNIFFIRIIFRWITANFSDSQIRTVVRILRLKKHYGLKFIEQNAKLVERVMNITKSRPISTDHQRLTVHFFLNMAASYQIALESLRNNSIFILEEGFAHKATTIFASVEENDIDFKEIENYLNEAPKIHAIINVKANEALCQKRLRERKLPIRLEYKTDDEIMKFLIKSKSVIDFTVGHLGNKGVQILTITNEGDVLSKDSLIEKISKELSKL